MTSEFEQIAQFGKWQLVKLVEPDNVTYWIRGPVAPTPIAQVKQLDVNELGNAREFVVNAIEDVMIGMFIAYSRELFRYLQAKRASLEVELNELLGLFDLG